MHLPNFAYFVAPLLSDVEACGVGGAPIVCLVAISTFSTGTYAGFDRIICGSLSSNIPVAAIPVSVGSSVYKRINRLRRNYLLVSKFKAVDTISAYSKQLAHASCPEDIKIKHIVEVPSCSPRLLRRIALSNTLRYGLICFVRST